MSWWLLFDEFWIRLNIFKWKNNMCTDRGTRIWSLSSTRFSSLFRSWRTLLSSAFESRTPQPMALQFADSSKVDWRSRQTLPVQRRPPPVAWLIFLMFDFQRVGTPFWSIDCRSQWMGTGYNGNCDEKIWKDETERVWGLHVGRQEEVCGPVSEIFEKTLTTSMTLD